MDPPLPVPAGVTAGDAPVFAPMPVLSCEVMWAGAALLAVATFATAVVIPLLVMPVTVLVVSPCPGLVPIPSAAVGVVPVPLLVVASAFVLAGTVLSLATFPVGGVGGADGL